MTRHNNVLKKLISYILVLFMLLSQPCSVFAENPNLAEPVSANELDESVVSSETEIAAEKIEHADENTAERFDESIDPSDASDESDLPLVFDDEGEMDVPDALDNPDDLYGSDPSVMRVYQNTGAKEFDTASTIIGYIKLHDNKTATYMAAIGASSSNPLSAAGNVIVPRRVIVSTYNGSLPTYFGTPCVYDYTDSGYDLDENGYAIDHVTKEIIQVKGDDGEMVDLYMGKEYTITTLDENCFKNEKCKLAQKITIPNTIVNDLTVDFFSECISCASISVDKKPEDEGLTLSDGVNRYVTGRKNGKNNEEVSEMNVLIDQRPNISLDGIGNVENYVIWCPPNFGANTYEIAWEENIAIGPKAFKNCKRLKSVTTASNTPVVFFIGESAFEGCESLINVDRLTKNEKLKYIDDRAFYGCTSLKNMNFWETSVYGTRLGEFVFYDTPITKLVLPYGYHEMNGATFYGMNSLKAFDVKEYEGYENASFIDIDDCLYRYEDPDNKEDSKLELVCHPAMKMDPEDTFKLSYNVVRLDPYAVSYCKMTDIIFPSTIYELDTDAIKYCTSLKNLYFFSGMPELAAADEDDIFEGCITSRPSKLTVYAGEGTKIYNYSVLKGFTVKALYSEDWFEFTDPDAEGNVQVVRFAYSQRADDQEDIYPEVVVPDFIIRGGVKHFVTGIGEGVFAEPNITTVMFLYHMKDIDANAFRIVPDVTDFSKDINAESLEEIIVEDGNEFLTTEDGVLYAKELKRGSKTEYLITDLLYYPVGNTATSYTTKDSLISLPENAFRGAYNLRYINIYDSIVTIGKIDNTTTDEPAAFAGCKNLVKVNIIHKEGVPDEDIVYASDDGVLYEYDNGVYIRLLYYPKARRIMDGDNSSAMAYEVVPGCKEIVDMKDCQYLMSVTFPNTVEIIDDGALSNCTALSTVIFEKADGTNRGIRKIGDEAFLQARIRSLYIPGSVESIGYSAFYRCPQLEEVRIDGDNLQYIGMRCFYDSPNLTTVTISGTQKNETGSMVTLDQKAFAECPNLVSVAVTNMEKVTIEDACFYDDTLLKDVTFYSSVVDKIGIGAFEGDCAIESLDLSESILLTQIEEDAFLDCTGLREITLPFTIQTLGDRTFKNCKHLMYINFDNLISLESIGAECFYGCFFTKAEFTNRLTTISDGAFDHNPMLCALYIPESLVGDFTTGNPFRGYGKELFVYGIAGSPVEAFIASLGANGPTFVAGDIPYALVTVDPASKELFDKGDTSTIITAYVTSEKAIDTSVKWVSDNDEIAQIDDLGGADGKYQITVSAKKHGIVRIYAINKATGEMACSVITYRESGIELSPSPNTGTITSYNKDGSTYVTYNIKMNTKGMYNKIHLNGSSVPARQVYYRSENPAIAKVDGKGVVTARKPGVATIICYAGKKENNTYAETVATVTVYTPSIQMNQKKLSLNRVVTKEQEDDRGNMKEIILSDNYEATLNVTHEGASSEVQWKTSNKNIVDFVDRSKTNSSAVIRAGKRAGTATITANCNGIVATCKVTVLPTSLRVNRHAFTLYSGGEKADSIALKATVKGVDKKVIWASDREDVAVVSDKGVVTAVAPGKAKITVTSNGLTDECEITVLEAKTRIFELTEEGTKQEVSEIWIDSKGKNRKRKLIAEGTGRKPKVVWKSSDKTCASISGKGILTAKSAPDAQIFAIANGVEAMVDVHIADTSIQIDDPVRELFVDSKPNESELFAEICGADKECKITWEVPPAYKDIIAIKQSNVAGQSGLTDKIVTKDPKKSVNNWLDGYIGTGKVYVVAKKKGKAKVNLTANGITKTFKIVVN